MPETITQKAAPLAASQKNNSNLVTEKQPEEVQTLAKLAGEMQSLTQLVESLLAKLTEQLTVKDKQIEELYGLLQKKALPRPGSWWRKMLRLED